MTRRYALRDDQWERIKDLLPGRKGTVGVTAADNRRLVEAVIYRYRSGIAWRDLPDRFGDFRVIHTRHMRWSRGGVWSRVFACLAEEADHEYAMIDSTIVRAHQPAAGARDSTKKKECIGRSKGGLSTNIHTVCDALGNPTGCHLTPGQAHDLQGADVLLPNLLSALRALLADKAYEAEKRVRAVLQKAGIEAVIPPKAHRKEPRDYDEHVYKERALIENFFAKLKQFRAIATRYDKTAVAFLGAVHLAATTIWLN